MKSFHVTNLPQALTRFFTLLFLTLTLAACGGGGDGFPGVRTSNSGTAVALNVAAPSSVTVAAGSAQTYSISGGTAPYRVVSGNIMVSKATLVGTDSLNIPGSAVGSAQVVVFDATNKSVTINVTVVDQAPLFISAPNTVTIDLFNSATYTIGGGTPMYSASSDNPSVVDVQVIGTSLWVTSLKGGTAKITVTDRINSATVTINVIAGSLAPLTTTAPSAITLGIFPSDPSSISPTYYISGGSAPYNIQSDNNNAELTSGGTTFYLKGLTAGTTNITITDSNNHTIKIPVIVTARSIALYTTAPNQITISTGGEPSYNIDGGIPDYVVVSNNTAVATVDHKSGSKTFKIKGNNPGTANIVITDAIGTTQTIQVTVNATITTPLVVTPGSTTASLGDQLTFAISGGAPSYTVVVSNASIAQANSVSSTTTGYFFTVNMLKVGSTTVAVTDALGQTTTLTLKVDAGAATLRLSPTTLTVGENFTGTIPLKIYGGASGAIYTAYTSDMVLSSVLLSDTTLNIGLGSQNNRCITTASYGSYNITITVVDNLGASANSILTIQDNGGATCP